MSDQDFLKKIYFAVQRIESCLDALKDRVEELAGSDVDSDDGMDDDMDDGMDPYTDDDMDGAFGEKAPAKRSKLLESSH